tara:strand:- start:1427 stop:2110 length:684 start_codon:yes stop_codon:yes gene_type:complete
MTIPIKIISAEEFEKTSDKPNQEQIWDVISVPWEKYIVKKILVVDEFLKGKVGKILDLGCGSGRNMIPEKGREYYSVDFSDKQIKNAEKYARDEGVSAKFFKLKADDLSEFEDEMFDSGLFIATLHCLESEEERLGSLREFYRVLKPNAEGLISVWDAEDDRFNGLKGGIYMSWMEDRKKYMRYYYLYSKDELIELLEGVGFKILEVYDKREGDRFSKKNLILRVGK